MTVNDHKMYPVCLIILCLRELHLSLCFQICLFKPVQPFECWLKDWSPIQKQKDRSYKKLFIGSMFIKLGFYCVFILKTWKERHREMKAKIFKSDFRCLHFWVPCFGHLGVFSWIGKISGYFWKCWPKWLAKVIWWWQEHSPGLMTTVPCSKKQTMLLLHSACLNILHINFCFLFPQEIWICLRHYTPPEPF